MATCETEYQFIGWTLLNTTAISSIVSTRVYHGVRLDGTTLPAINYYKLAGGKRANGVERAVYTINCRAADVATALKLASYVVDVFSGSYGTGTYGTNNGFTVARVSVVRDNGLIIEPDASSFNAPIDISVLYTK